jgi:hypothetical protein
MSFLEELAKKGLINGNQIGEIKSRAQDKYEGNIDEALIESGVSEDKILIAKGEYLGLPVKNINPEEMSFDALKYISEDSAAYYHFVPIELKEGVLAVGIMDPENIQAMDALQFISAKIGIPFKVFLISKSNYETVMQSYKGIGTQVEESLKELNQEYKRRRGSKDCGRRAGDKNRGCYLAQCFGRRRFGYSYRIHRRKSESAFSGGWRAAHHNSFAAECLYRNCRAHKNFGQIEIG